MGALRKAGVWLGLVEEEDEPGYDTGYADEFADDEDDFAPPARPHARTRPVAPRTGDRDRASDRAAERGLRAADLRGSDRETRLEQATRSERDRLERTDRADGDRTERDRIDRDRQWRAERDRTERAEQEQVERERLTATRTETHRSDSSRAESSRAESSRADSSRIEQRGSVRPLARPGSSGSSYPTQDNLALAPQVQLRERAVVADEKSRRYQITTLHLTTYTEARTIGEHFRDGVPVIINLTEMDEPDARRLVDFAAGLAFGLRGNIERVTNRVFLLSPANVEVTAEDKARIAEGGFFDQG